MIRVIILLIFLFLVWVLYASGFEKPRKIRICIIALVMCAVGFWIDGRDRREMRNLVKVEDVSSCGVTAKFSYRTNFNVDICVNNNASKGTITRLKLAVIASKCAAGSCQELQRVERDMLVDIAPSSTSTLEQNLSFDKLTSSSTGLTWSFEVLDTKAHR